MFDLENKVALITGAARGIGKGIAIKLASQGSHIAISDKSVKSLEDTKKESEKYGNRVFTFKLDLKINDHIKNGTKLVAEEFGKIDILINNAGINHPLPGLEVTEENWDEHYKVNVKGGFFLAQQVAKIMIKNGWGRIIWISSQSGLVGIPGQSVYCSTKGAIIQLVRTLGVEWARYGITVNSVAPTFVETELTRERLKNKEYNDYVFGKIPAKKLATIDDVSAAAVFLASEETGMINCHTLCVDGGWTAW